MRVTWRTGGRREEGRWPSARMRPGESRMVMPRLLIVEHERIIARDVAQRLTKRGSTVVTIVGPAVRSCSRQVTYAWI